MITFKKFGRKGRLGNQLFHLAGMIGLGKKYGHEVKLPSWKYSVYFKNIPQVNHGMIGGFKEISEQSFHYVESEWEALKSGNHDISDWLQSEKYWAHCVDEVRTALTWEANFQKHVLISANISDLNTAIAISVRRGDYVSNPNYDLLPVSYYLQALRENFPDYLDRRIMIFSDDIPYCKIHFSGLPNVWFADGFNDITQLCLMSNCNSFVISNSTFAWWGAYLAELRNPGVKIVRPKYLFAGQLLQRSDSKDHWPERWLVYDHKVGGEARKHDLRDVTFTIPVMYDHHDRKQNLDLSVCMLQRAFETNIFIGEAITNKFEYMSQWCKYKHYDLDCFHRTKMLNDLAWNALTPIIANWDADVFVPECQIVVAVDLIRQGRKDGVYPYDGRFARVPRKQWFASLEHALDLEIFKGETFKGTRRTTDRSSVGGAVIWNASVFFKGGGENEYFISHAPEDAERWERFRLLGYKVDRVNGQLFHMDHHVGPNSSNGHGFRDNNGKYWAEFQSKKTAEQLWEYVKSWPWYNRYYGNIRDIEWFTWCDIAARGDFTGYDVDKSFVGDTSDHVLKENDEPASATYTHLKRENEAQF